MFIVNSMSQFIRGGKDCQRRSLALDTTVRLTADEQAGAEIRAEKVTIRSLLAHE